MALTPEQILNKHFQTTQFRKGYDERDVDDFLDVIVAEMRSLVAQRDDFKQLLNDCRAGRGLGPVMDLPKDDGPAGAEVAGAPVDTAGEDEAQARLEELHQRIAQAQAQEKELEERVARARADADAAEQEAPPAQEQGGGGEPEVGSTTGTMRAVAAGGAGGASAAALIELAQRLHDEHVGKGEATRDELIFEGQRQHDDLVGTAQARHDELLSTGQAQHDELVGSAQSQHDELLSIGQSRHEELVTTAQTRHDDLLAEATSKHEQLITEGRERSTGMVAEAQGKKAAVLAELEHEKGRLEKQIEELRGFERNYRSQLKAYLQGQLQELDHTGVDPVEGSDLAGEGSDEGASTALTDPR